MRNNVTRTVDDLRCCAQFTTRYLGIYIQGWKLGSYPNPSSVMYSPIHTSGHLHGLNAGLGRGNSRV